MVMVMVVFAYGRSQRHAMNIIDKNKHWYKWIIDLTIRGLFGIKMRNSEKKFHRDKVWRQNQWKKNGHNGIVLKNFETDRHETTRQHSQQKEKKFHWINEEVHRKMKACNIRPENSARVHTQRITCCQTIIIFFRFTSQLSEREKK